MKLSNKWKDYQILDAGDGEKLEKWNDVVLRRPDPMAIWPKKKLELWDNVDACYHRSKNGGGSWQFNKKIKDFWTCNYDCLKFKISPTNFKHTGLFPEQAYNWDLVMNLISKRSNKKDIKVLNLFGYTGAATIAASFAGAKEVVHVDASKGMISWAKENINLNNLNDNKVRFIEDDCIKFMQREIRRGREYDLIIMDPPSYGRGPNNELFKFEEKINILLDLATKLLTNKPIGVIVNSYTTGYSPIVLKNLMKHHFKKFEKGVIESDELCLEIDERLLPCGLTTSFIIYD